MTSDLFARQQTLGAMLRRTAARTPDSEAILCGSRRWTYSEFDAEADKIAAGFAAYGLRKGDRVAILSRNSHAFAAVRFGAARAGVAIVPINFMLRPSEIAYILKHSGVRWLFVDEVDADAGREAAEIAGNIERFIGLPSEGSDTTPNGMVSYYDFLEYDQSTDVDVSDQDLAQIIYTSGTESLPKGAMLSHSAILWQYQSCLFELNILPQDRFLHTMPMFHCAQLDTFLGPCIAAGATNVITATPSAENLQRLMKVHNISSFFAPPTIWINLMSDGMDSESVGASLSKAYYGASMMPVEVLGELRRRFPQIGFWNCYGQTEIAPLATVLHPDEHDQRPGSVGRAVLNVQTRLIDDNGCDVAVGEVGEIVHRSPQLMMGYLNDPAKTAEAFEGGWFHSGDLGTIDEQGFIRVVDRKKDMIKSGGENVASSEVENAIYKHPLVEEVAVIGLPDPKWIEAVTAIIVPKPGECLTEEEVIAHCSQSLAGFKTPKRVIFMEQIPKNASGKLLKRELRARFT